MLTAILALALIVIAVAGAELVRSQCRRMLATPHPVMREPRAGTALP